MRKYVIKRILMVLPVLFGISVLVFSMARLIPGDVVAVMLGTNTDPKTAAELRHFLGLDQPMWRQYLEWLWKLLRGDMGVSLRTGRSVAGEIVKQFPATVELATTGMVLSLLVAIPIGTISAVRRNTWLDYGGRIVAILGVATPDFWLGTMLILVFALWLRVLPAAGYAPLFQHPLQSIRYMILPAFSLGTALMAVVMRMTRSTMLEVVRQDYIRTARAKGVAERMIVYKHALRNALIPVVTVIGMQAGYILGGSVIIEQVFARPGIGRLALQAINQRDYPMVQGAVLFITLVFVTINLMVDVVYAYIDPRIHYQ
ncbi:MAG: binding-protein-dependent transport system inner rane component [Firmicutes bacterium]|nr:binding-protein-dependent transport system inner rane component [Bacillota bacterium]